MKKILFGMALGLTIRQLVKAKNVRKFLRKKIDKAGTVVVNTLVDVWKRNGMTDEEFDNLNSHVNEALDIVERRSGRRQLKIVKDA